MDDPRRATPRTDHVLADPRLLAAAARLGPGLLKQVVGRTLERCRRGEVAPDEVVAAVLAALPEAATGMRRVLNATGVIVHTNLGRAPLSDAALNALAVAAGATDVELDLESGRRGGRGRSALAALADAVPDAEAVHVVNNGAAAVALVACAMAAGREVVVARGELVEIGDGFRLPELVESVGARIREVGTTNRVRPEDYAAAVGEETAFVLKVHPSNFRVTGFTSTVPVSDLAQLPAPVVVDIGSGLLRPHPRLPEEPSASAALRDGADLVTASGDKLLGGPQCGLLLGRADLLDELRRFPLARAMRVDKLTLAALEATLLGPTPPVLEALGRSIPELRERAARLAAAIGGPTRVVESVGVVGGGGAPGVELPSAAVALPAALAGPLRLGELPVVGRVESGVLLLDLLALDPADDDRLAASVKTALARG